MNRWDLYFYHFAAIATWLQQTANLIHHKPCDYTIPILFFAVANLTREFRKRRAEEVKGNVQP